jgi:hypothetical protein
VQIASSPSLGGVIDVSLGLCKKWEVALHEESLLEDDPELLTGDVVVGDPVEGDTPMPDQGGDPPLPMSEEEQAQLVFYNVYKILKHKYQGGWKFLVWWENFPASSSTWEPVASFVQPGGRMNEVFKNYCVDHNLQSILRQALRMFCDVSECEWGLASQETAWPPPKCFDRAFSHAGGKSSPPGGLLDGFSGQETPTRLAMGGLLSNL